MPLPFNHRALTHEMGERIAFLEQTYVDRDWVADRSESLQIGLEDCRLVPHPDTVHAVTMVGQGAEGVALRYTLTTQKSLVVKYSRFDPQRPDREGIVAAELWSRVIQPRYSGFFPIVSARTHRCSLDRARTIMSVLPATPLKNWLSQTNGTELQMTVMETARGDLQGLLSSQLLPVPDAVIIPILFKIYWSIMCAQRCIPGFRHNDLKPDNILLLSSCDRTPDTFRLPSIGSFVFMPSGEQPLINDFGWAYYDTIPGGFRAPTHPGQTTCGISSERDYYHDVFTFVHRFMRTPALTTKISRRVQEHFNRLVNPIFFRSTVSQSINTLDRFDFGAYLHRYGIDDPCVQAYAPYRRYVDYIHDVVLGDELFRPYRQTQSTVDGRAWALPPRTP